MEVFWPTRKLKTKPQRYYALIMPVLCLLLSVQNATFASIKANARPAKLLASVSDNHCAILKTGQINCWGAATGGRLGNGTTSGTSNIGVLVSNISNAVSIAGNYFTYCAGLSDGTAKCWGGNSYGTIGDGTSIQRNTPVAVSGLSQVKTVVAGTRTMYALLADGTVRSWGGGGAGELGDGTNTVSQLTPVTVTGLSDVIDIDASNGIACAVTANGSVYCWGTSSPNFTASNVPLLISGISNAKAVSVAGSNASVCVLLSTGTVKCWGDNRKGDLGLGSADTSAHTTPTTVPSLTDVIDISSEAAESQCVIKAQNRQLLCWGSNLSGLIGDGTSVDRYSPTAGINLSAPVLAVTTDYASSCALLANGQIQCSGSNSYGALGDGTYTNRTSFGTNVILTSEARTGTEVVTSGYHTCGKANNGTIRCWGKNNYGQVGDASTINRSAPVSTAALYTYDESLSVGAGHSCALLADGTAQCWGDNYYGQVGDGTTTGSSSPRDVSGLLSYKGLAIAAGGTSTCSLLADGTVKCWGDNYFGQLGDSTVIGRTAPVSVLNISTARYLGTGNGHACAVRGDGTVACWGYNGYGQLGDGSYTNRTIPVTVSGLSNVISVVGGLYHSCALLSSGIAKCWGRNVHGELGSGNYSDSLTPVPVVTSVGGSALNNIVALTSGFETTCALLANGTSKCWGYNKDGSSGDGTIVQSALPVSVLGMSDMLSIAADNSACATKVNGQVWCWGANVSGQVGNSAPSSYELTPLQIGGFPY